MPGEHTRVGHRGGQVERGLAAQPGKQAFRPLGGDHRLDRFDGQRLEVDGVGDRRVGHDRGRIGVDEDRPDPFGAQRPAGLRSGVVELSRLADDDRSGTQDQHRGGLWARSAHPARASCGRHEPVEHLERVQRPRRAFRVVLDGLDRQLPVTQPLDGAVVEIDLADVEPGCRRDRMADHLDLVVLGGHLDTPKVQVLDRMVGAVMAEPQPRRLRAAGARDDLVPEADPEQRAAGGDHGAGEGDLGPKARRVAGAGRQDHPVDVARQQLRRTDHVREYPDPRPTVPHRSHDVRFQTEIDDPDPGPFRGVRRVLCDRRRRHLTDEVLVLPGGDGARHRHGGDRIHVAGGGDDPAQATAGAQVARKGPGIDTGDRRDPGTAEEGCQLARSLEDRGGRVGDNQRAQPWTERLIVVEQPTVVPDQRIGHHDDLAGVRRVGADLLVAGLAGVHDQVATGRHRRTKGDPREDRAILEGQHGGTRDRRSEGRRPPRRAGTAGRSRGQVGTRHGAGGKGLTVRLRGAAARSADRRGHGRSASFPASRDRYAGLTGPAMKGLPGEYQRRAALTRTDAGLTDPETTLSDPTPPWTSMSTRFADEA